MGLVHRRFDGLRCSLALHEHGNSGVRWVGLILIGVVSFMLVPRVAHGISIVEVNRSVNITGCIFDPIYGMSCRSSSAIDPVGYGGWASGLSDRGFAASQASLVNETELTGTGSVSMGLTDGNAATQYHVVFAVSTATNYNFTVNNLDANPCCTGSPSGSVRLSMVDPANPSLVVQSIYSVFLVRRLDGGIVPDFSAQGTLAPGTYALDFGLGVAGSHIYAAPGSAGFALLIVPEPSTALLLTSGLLGLATRRKRA